MCPGWSDHRWTVTESVDSPHGLPLCAGWLLVNRSHFKAQIKMWYIFWKCRKVLLCSSTAGSILLMYSQKITESKKQKNTSCVRATSWRIEITQLASSSLTFPSKPKSIPNTPLGALHIFFCQCVAVTMIWLECECGYHRSRWPISVAQGTFPFTFV